MSKRQAAIERKTNETQITGTLVLDGTGKSEIDTGVGLLNHLLDSMVRFARFDLTLTCKGDLHVDDHHTAEDCALALGAALDEALGDRAGIARFGWALTPMDGSLARGAVDLSGRPYAAVELDLQRDKIGDLACENIAHVLHSLAIAARMTLHADTLRGDNDHHRAEAVFKALGLALRQAIAIDGGGVPSTKGVL